MKEFPFPESESGPMSVLLNGEQNKSERLRHMMIEMSLEKCFKKESFRCQ